MARVRTQVQTPADLSRLFGCSARTARRLMATEPGAVPCLRRIYALRAARNTGATVTFLCGEEYRTEKFITGWENVRDKTEARRTAGLMAMQIATFASFGFDVPADYTVTHGVDGMPLSVEIIIQPVPGIRHRLFFGDSTGKGRTLLHYYNPFGELSYNAASTEKSLTIILNRIRYECKNISSKKPRQTKKRNENTRG